MPSEASLVHTEQKFSQVGLDGWDEMGWDGMDTVFMGHQSSKSTFGANIAGKLWKMQKMH